MKEKSKYFHLYLFFAEFLGAVCFYCGFFPTSTSSNRFSTMGELPDINNTKLDSLFAYKNHFDKCIIVVIDSLRYDFVDTSVFFPYLSEQLNKKESCLFKARVQSPTVTLPRIKSLLTGSVPGFLDVISNFGKSELISDNVLKQAKTGGYKTIFYGDETWINLLPHTFERSEGTVSFFVSDYTEVDLNVTRNVEVELNRSDWDIMILHYLGLDHIGHLEGPRSKLVKPKLLEMDSVISKINENYLRTNEKVLIVVCGDHGMKDSGGHGGTSLPEVLIPVAILNYECIHPMNEIEIGQIDLAPLLSVLLGLPIPYDSIGKLHYKMLTGLDEHHSLYALYYNTIRLHQKFMEYYPNDTFLNNELNNSINNGINFYKKFSNSHSYSDYLNSAKYLTRIQEILSDRLMSININYDVSLMIFGMILFLQSAGASVFGNHCVSKISFKGLFIVTVITLIFHYVSCILSDSTSTTCSLSITYIFFALLIYILIIWNIMFIQYSRRIKFNFTFLRRFLIVSVLFHVVSLTSSSYIEEEHQFWYFFIVTFILLFIKNDFLWLSAILISHRFLRYINQTGDKWASLPDLEDWFLEHNIVYLLLFYSFCLITTFIICRSIISHIYPFLMNLFTIGQFFSIFMYKIMSGSIKLANFEPTQHLGIILARCVWVFSLLKTVFILKSLKNSGRLSSYNQVVKKIVDFLLEMFLIIISLLYKPHNLILIPSLFFFSHIMVKNFKNDKICLIYLHYSLGTIFYFYQGNSNSISTIDVSPGYVGLEHYNFFITGFLIALNTFSAPILAFLLLLRAIAKDGKFNGCQAEIFHILTVVNGLKIIVYAFIMTIQRNHIFIWSVFAPKLLYVLSFIVLDAILIFVLLMIDFWSKFIANCINFSSLQRKIFKLKNKK